MVLLWQWLRQEEQEPGHAREGVGTRVHAPRISQGHCFWADSCRPAPVAPYDDGARATAAAEPSVDEAPERGTADRGTVYRQTRLLQPATRFDWRDLRIFLLYPPCLLCFGVNMVTIRRYKRQ
ncbi:hypothetical protein B0H12DRAFT_753345 [Mycena haematopus]|nr:hypothetical protein B0H12DRAFT_753345 [Mycena haematopus]